MPVTERLMQPGSWSLQLRPETPKFVRDALAYYGHICIYDDPIDGRSFDDATMKARARYIGILRRRQSVWDLEGPGLLSWLGNEFGVGDIFEAAVALTDNTFAQWITALLPPGGAVVAGAISAPYQLLSNPGFESAGTWVAQNTGTGTTALQDTTPHGGANNLKLTNPTAGNYGGAYNSIGIPISGMAKLKVTWWGKATVAGNSGPFRVTFANAGTNVSVLGIATAQPSAQAGVSVVDTTSTLTVNYTQFTATVTVPAGFTWAFIEIYGSTGSGTVTPTFYDDIVVEGLLTQSFNQQTPRTAIEWIMGHWAPFGAVYRVNNDGTLDAGPVSSLFKSTPTAVAVRRGSRDAGPLAGLAVTTLDADFDVDDYASRVLYIGAGGTAAASGADTTFKDLRGNNAKLTKLINNSATTAGLVPQEAAIQAGIWVKQPRTRVKFNSEQFDVTRDVRVGDNLYVFDQERGIVDVTNQIPFQGRILFPQIWQALAITWPVQPNMGVYYRPKSVPNGGSDYIDLGPYLLWDTSGASFEVGAAARRLV